MIFRLWFEHYIRCFFFYTLSDDDICWMTGVFFLVLYISLLMVLWSN
jgi:hypothetical protein